MTRSVTIRDVASEAGFSVATVSNVLRGGQGHVYPEATYAKIRSTAERLGYQANAAARLMRQNNRTLIGMPVALTEHPYLSRFLLAVQDELLKHEYEPAFLNMGHLAYQGETAPFPPLQMLAGLVTVGLELQAGWPALYERLPIRFPVISLQPVSEEVAQRVSVVQVDFADAYRQVLGHLLELGHKNIAFLNVLESPLPSDSAKNGGWLTALEQRGITPGLFLDWSKIASPTAQEAAQEEDDYIYHSKTRHALPDLVEQLTSFPERITALVCTSDEVAIGVQSYLQSRGWKLPEQLSIVGYDGISFGAYVYPSLTTVAPDYPAMAKKAVQHLLACLDPSSENTVIQRITVEPNLIIRASTAPPKND